MQKEDTEDLLQECLTHWYLNKSRYDPAREASQKTFMFRVVRIRLLEIVRYNTSHKRKISHLSWPLDDFTKDSIPDSANKTHYDSQLTSDIKKALHKLSPRQRKLCGLLLEEGLNITDAAKQLGINRRTVYDDLSRIREVFKKEGLRDYL